MFILRERSDLTCRSPYLLLLIASRVGFASRDMLRTETFISQDTKENIVLFMAQLDLSQNLIIDRRTSFKET